MTDVDNDKLGALVGKMLGDLGGAFSVPTVRIGFRLGLFDALHNGRPGDRRRAGASGPAWPSATCANGRWRRPPTATSTFDTATGRFSLSPEQAMVFAVKDSPVYLEGAFDLVAAMIEGEPKVERGVPRPATASRWGDSAGCLFCAVGAFFRPGYVNNIVQSWLPALDGVADEAEGRRQGRRCRLRRRLFDPADGEGVPEEHVRRLRLPRAVDRAGQRARAGARPGRPRAFRDRARPRISPNATSTSSPCSTACTTWATRAAARRTCAAC